MLCSRCQKDKSPSEFYDKSPKSTYCKDCHNRYSADRLTASKIKAIKLLGNQCQDCEQSFHYSVYDFHHLKGKDFSWYRLRSRKWSTIEAELSKCILLCANCHRIRHHG